MRTSLCDKLSETFNLADFSRFTYLSHKPYIKSLKRRKKPNEMAWLLQLLTIIISRFATKQLLPLGSPSTPTTHLENKIFFPFSSSSIVSLPLPPPCPRWEFFLSHLNLCPNLACSSSLLFSLPQLTQIQVLRHLLHFLRWCFLYPWWPTVVIIYSVCHGSRKHLCAFTHILYAAEQNPHARQMFFFFQF